MRADGNEHLSDPEPVTPQLYAGDLLLQFVDGDRYLIDTPLQQIVVGTFQRSRLTFTGVLNPLTDDLPVQAAMLGRALFEDVVVAHWLVLNSDDPDWLIERFFAQRDAIELHRQRLSEDTHWNLPTVRGADASDARRRQNELSRTFGAEARRDWWDPGTEGRGRGRPIGMRGVAAILEDAALAHERFHPRFGGGDEPLLRRLERVMSKWFSQCLHHTAVGLPIVIAPAGELPVDPDAGESILTFSTWWLFSQQIYLLHDFHERPYEDFNELVKACYVGAWGASDSQLKPFDLRPKA